MTLCTECSAEWGGEKAGHCTRCHRTFSTDKNFDAHLVIEKGPGVFKVVGCVDPLSLLREDGTRRFKARRNSRGTDIFVSADPYKPSGDAA